jgi:hypothetical protein
VVPSNAANDAAQSRHRSLIRIVSLGCKKPINCSSAAETSARRLVSPQLPESEDGGCVYEIRRNTPRRERVTDKEIELPKHQTEDPGPRCPTCSAFPRLLTSMLQPRSGKTVKLYRCDCGQRIWND